MGTPRPHGVVDTVTARTAPVRRGPHTRSLRTGAVFLPGHPTLQVPVTDVTQQLQKLVGLHVARDVHEMFAIGPKEDRKSTRLNSSHLGSSYAVLCLKK